MAADSDRATPVSALIAAAIGLVAVVAYLPALGVGFTADDFFILARLKQLDGLHHPLAYFVAPGFFEYYRPLAFLSLAADWHLWGLGPAGYHATNLMLHAANAVLVLVLGWRLGGRTTGVVAGLLFALHPSSQEAAYWVSARFDLLATCLTLAALLLISGGPRAYAAGVLAFGLALLSKESALALPVIALAHDVLIRRLDWTRAARRLAPLAVVAVGYGILRSQAGALEAAGGASRLPKILMLATLVGGLLWIARARASRPSPFLTDQRARVLAMAAAAAGIPVLALLFVPAVSPWIRSKIGFASFSLYYLLTPVAVPPLPPAWFDLPSVPQAIVELLLVAALLVAAWTARRWIATNPAAQFCLVFVAAALVPVSSMTTSPRYLYLASAGLLVLAGLIVEALPAAGRLRRAGPVVAGLLMVSTIQIVAAGRSWQWASTMTSDALDQMTSAARPCGTRDLVVLTTPAGIRGVYSNLNEVAFDVLDCVPASYVTVLRVVGLDATVTVTRQGDTILMRVPVDRGNFVGSRDLRHFDEPMTGPDLVTLETPVGRLESEPSEGGRIFRLTLDDRRRGARFFYYSDGRLHALR